MLEGTQSLNAFYTLKNFLITSLISVAYVLISSVLVGFKSDQIVLLLIFNIAFYASRFSRKFILGFSIFIVYWIIFDYMKAFPNYRFHTVSIKELYDMEKHLFGIHTQEAVLTPNEFLKLHTSKAADLITGIFYLLWIPVPLAFAGYLFFRNKLQFLYFSFTFVLVNFIGFIIYYLYPAAPPWYVQLHGFQFIAHTPGNTAGLARFDQLVNMPIFKSIYSKSSNVFAAMPSLHSSYPVIVLYYGLKNRLGLVNLFFVLVMLGIWFTALYTSHHYLLDVLAGVTCAAVGIATFNWISLKQPISNWLKRFEAVIS